MNPAELSELFRGGRFTDYRVIDRDRLTHANASDPDRTGHDA